MARNNYLYKVGQTVKVRPFTKTEMEDKYRGNILWDNGGTRTKSFFGKKVTIEHSTDHCGGLCYEVKDERGLRQWIYEDCLLPPSREDLIKNLLNGDIDVPTFNELVKVVD